MKKLFGFFVIAFAIFGVALVSSCEKNIQSTPYVINDSITATLKGVAYADLDQTNTDWEFVPSGTKIFIKVALIEYNPNAANGEFKIYTATVGASGAYTIQIPSNSRGVDFTVIPDEFEYMQIQWDNTTEKEYYIAGSHNGYVIANQTYLYDIVY